MKSKIHKKSMAIALPLMLLMSVAQADWGLSLDLDNQHQRYKDTKDDAKALLGIEYRGEKFNMDKKAISYSFTNSKKLTLEAILKNNNRGFEESDSKLFKGMDKRKDSIDIGARAFVETGVGPVVLEMTRDVYASKGYEADLRLGGITPHSKHWTGQKELSVSPVFGVKYQSKKVVDYYYGVKGTESNATRDAYSGKAATTPYAGVEAQFNLNKRVSLNAGVFYERRDDAVQNSPLTNNKDSDVIGNIGISYWF